MMLLTRAGVLSIDALAEICFLNILVNVCARQTWNFIITFAGFAGTC